MYKLREFTVAVVEEVSYKWWDFFKRTPIAIRKDYVSKNGIIWSLWVQVKTQSGETTNATFRAGLDTMDWLETRYREQKVSMRLAEIMDGIV